MNRRLLALTAAPLAALFVLLGAVTAPAAPKKAAPRAAAHGDTVLVRIGKDTITPRDVAARLQELPEPMRASFNNPEGRQRLLERMVEERVWLTASLSHGVADRPEVKRQIEQQRRDLLIRTYVTEVMGKNPPPSDSAAKDYYDAHEGDYKTPATVTVSHVQLKTEAEAKRVKAWAKAGQDWKSLAAKYSTDTLTRANGGALGTVTHDGVFGSIGAQPALAESAFALGTNGIGGPYKTDRGWHVIHVDQVKPEGIRTFDQMRQSIIRQISSKSSQDYYNARLSELKQSLGVKPDSSAIKGFVSQRKTAREMFNEAQTAGPAATRIDAYRALLKEYPESEVSPQAEFMIGFINSEELKNYEAAEASFKELLARWPKSELAASAKWMLEHMRTEGAPAFMNLEADSSVSSDTRPGQTSTHKP